MNKKRISLLLCLIIGFVLQIYYIFEFVREPNFWYEYIYITVPRYQGVEFWVAYVSDVIVIIGAVVGLVKGLDWLKSGIITCLMGGIVGSGVSLYYPFSKLYFYQYPNLYLEFAMYFIILLSALYGYYHRKERAKGSGIDDQMKRVYHLSIGLLICGFTLFIILGMLGFFIGLPIGFFGLYGIIISRVRPDKLRNYLLKRNASKEEPKVQA